MKSSLVDVTVKLVHETDKAYLVTTDDEDRIWVPKSACEFTPIKNSKYGDLTLSESLATEKGLV